MDLRLDGRSALVCGASQGIGRSAAERLAEMGAIVTLSARNEDNLKDVVSELVVGVEIREIEGGRNPEGEDDHRKARRGAHATDVEGVDRKGDDDLEDAEGAR